MRIAVLSDIHSNLAALEAVLADCADADALWCLGDIVGYGPRPNEVVGLLRERRALSVAGNHDWAAIGRMDTSAFNRDAALAARWTAEALAADTREYLSRLSLTEVHGDWTLVHGSPRDPLWEYLLSGIQARENLEHFQSRFCLFGHTHLPTLFALRENGSLIGGLISGDTVVDLAQLGKRALLNPGSVGQPRDGNPHAAYLLLDERANTATWKRVAYPIHRTQEQMRQAGLPTRLVDRLAYGR